MKSKISDYLVLQGVLEKENINLFFYGIDVLWMNIIPVIIIIFISILLGDIVFGALFLLSFIPIRINIGGYHCKKVHNCIFVFTLIFLFCLFLYENFNNPIIYTLIGIISIAVISNAMPISYDKVDKIEKNTIKSKFRIKFFSFIILIVASLMYKYDYSIAVYMACIVNTILYILGYLDLNGMKYNKQIYLKLLDNSIK